MVFQKPRSASVRFSGVARNDGCIKRADGDSGNPVRVDAGFLEAFVDPGLIGAQRAATLQHEGHLVVSGKLERLARCNLIFLIVTHWVAP